MKIGVYLCECGGNISSKIDLDSVSDKIINKKNVAYVSKIELMCSPNGKDQFEKDLIKNKPQRVIIVACSPRDHETTFRKIMLKAKINPFLMQMINVREQVAWVTEDNQVATEKTIHLINGALNRVVKHDALEKIEIDTNNNVLIIGAGPAGLKAATVLAEAGRGVVLVEKSPMIGGMPVKYEDLFPNLECGPCMLEPLMDEVLHGSASDKIEVFTMSEVEEVKGFYGNFIAKIKKSPRYIDIEQCIGCGECVTPCPVSVKSEINYGLNEKKAVDFTFFGALPSAPYIDSKTCLKLNGKKCEECVKACPVDGAVNFSEKEEIIERNIGAVIVAIGSNLYPAGKLANLGYGKIQEVYTSYEFERLIASSGPTGGEIVMKNGDAPKSVAIVHCVGSLDEEHKKYCSGVCCQSAFKFNQVIKHKIEGAKVYHLFKEIVVTGPEAISNYEHAKHGSEFIRYKKIGDLKVSKNKDKQQIDYIGVDGKAGKISVDMVVLESAVVPTDGSVKISELLEITTNKDVFFENLHGKMDSAQSKVKGVYLAGTCESPKDINGSMTQAVAATAYILSGLIPGQKLEIEPIVAEINEDICAGCRICNGVCPYKAISYDEEKKKSVVTALLCHGCGTCVAACPAGAIRGHHFTDEQIFSELEGVLS